MAFTGPSNPLAQRTHLRSAGPLTDTIDDGTYGTVPVPVAKVCALTFYCSRSDPHPTTDGYTAIANQVLTAAGVA